MERTWLRWCPTSAAELRSAEAKLLSFMRSPYCLLPVDIGTPPGLRGQLQRKLTSGEENLGRSGDCFINTLVVGDHTAGNHPLRANERQVHHTPASDQLELPGLSTKPSLVLLHGYGASLGFFFRNFDALARHFNIFAVDLLGWGASSRPPFTPSTTEATHDWFVESLERWRKALRLTRFVLLGHSLGGYVAARYALRYPQHLSRLLLVGPAGFLPESQRMRDFRRTWPGFALHCLWEANVTPQRVARVLGPWGKEVVLEAFSRRWTDLPPGQEPMRKEEVRALAEYAYQTFCAPVSGELCMKHLFSLGAFARQPLMNEAGSFSVPTCFIYGEDDFMDYRAGMEAADRMKVLAEVLRVKQVGHMLFLENPSSFLDAVLHACQVQRLSSFKAVEVCSRDGGEPAFQDSQNLFAEAGGMKADRIVVARKLAQEWGVG